jgi:hypothetical protein
MEAQMERIARFADVFASEFANATPAQAANWVAGGAAGFERIRTVAQDLKQGTDITLAEMAAESDRKQRARKLTPLTVIFTPPQRATHLLPNQRDYKFTDFTGVPPKASDGGEKQSATEKCLGWLKRLNILCEQFGLDHTAARGMLQRHVIDAAGAVLEDAIADGADYTGCVVALEKAYAGLRHPDLAREECRRATRKDKEDLRRMAQRIRHLAKMATRDRVDRAQAAIEMNDLAVTTFTAALPPKTKESLYERLEARRRLGEPDPKYSDMVEEATNIEEKRKAAHDVYQSRTGGNTRLVEQLRCMLASDTASAVDDAIVEDAARVAEEDDSDDEVGELVRQLRQFQRSKAGGRSARPQAAARTAAITAAGLPTAPLPPTVPLRPEPTPPHVEMPGIDASVLAVQRMRITPLMLNVQKDECMKCGQPGHRAFGDSSKSCFLRDAMLTDKPCPTCNKGGHLKQDCPRKTEYPKN